ncbi:unnamed protein product [Schistosoma margrebowiei]|uniref:Uncharacterized protein n=1 Tax=Schistosoma margrebowiei TaxID=48269 RepID=A0A183MXJ1_9TREM|nr:unnamed protein product [Schistosoma margrebowiei]
MVVGGSQQETLDPGFVLLGTRQQGVPVILRELVLPGGFDLVSPSYLQPPSKSQYTMKIFNVPEASASVGLSIQKGRSKMLKYNTENTKPATLGGETLEEMETFTYLEIVIDE